MKYDVVINKKFSYVKSYKVLKSTRGNVNPVTAAIMKFMDKYVLKKQSI